MFADEFGFQRHCSFLEDLTSLPPVGNQHTSLENDFSEQIVPGGSDNLADIESSLYTFTSSTSVQSSCAMVTKSTSFTNTQMTCYTNDVISREIITPSPSGSDVIMQTRTSEDQHNKSSELLDDIMECIQTVDSTVTKRDADKGNRTNHTIVNL